MDHYEIISKKLDDYILKRFHYRKPAVRFGFCRNVFGVDRVKVDLYLRFFDDPALRDRPTIVIARMKFREQKRGHGTDLLQFLTQVAVDYNYEYIELESCNVNAKAFAAKFGFIFFDKNNCRIPVDQLKQRFHKEPVL